MGDPGKSWGEGIQTSGPLRLLTSQPRLLDKSQTHEREPVLEKMAPEGDQPHTTADSLTFEFNLKMLDEFWLGIKAIFLAVSERALSVLLSFCITCLYEVVL